MFPSVGYCQPTASPHKVSKKINRYQEREGGREGGRDGGGGREGRKGGRDYLSHAVTSTDSHVTCIVNCEPGFKLFRCGVDWNSIVLHVMLSCLLCIWPIRMQNITEVSDCSMNSVKIVVKPQHMCRLKYYIKCFPSSLSLLTGTKKWDSGMTNEILSSIVKAV